MEAGARKFRRQVRAENDGRRGKGLRYSEELRVAALHYLARRKREGASTEQAASELGVSGWSLCRWSRASSVRLRRVEVVESAEEATSLTLVTPRGYRIEGLSEEGLVRLVEHLG
jgi:hypothetical protein